MILSNYTVWPEEGGILQQDPLFLRRLDTYLGVKSKYDERKRAEEERKNKRKK